MNDKIKHLLDTAYKTDSIAINKWRIENREQLRKERKEKLKELMEKDKTMSNNKQSSVEILEDFLLQHCNPTICNVEWSDFKLAIEQAKEKYEHEMCVFADEYASYILDQSKLGIKGAMVSMCAWTFFKNRRNEQQ